MDFNSAIDILIKDLEEARAIIDDLKTIPGVPAFQVELAKSKCRSATEMMNLLRSLQFESSRPKSPDVAPQPAPEPEEIPVKITPVKPARSSNPVEEPEKPVKKKEKVTSTGGEVISGESIPADVHGEETIADRFSLERGLNFPAPSIQSSLSEAIGINDRFHFIREIFDNDPRLYSEVIGKLETITDIGEARSLIMGYAHDESSISAGKQLLDLVRRKLKSE